MEVSQKGLSHLVNAGRMRQLQYKDPVKVISESMTWGITGGIRSFSCSAGCLMWGDGLQRLLELYVVRRLILSNFCGDFLDPNAMGSKLVV